MLPDPGLFEEVSSNMDGVTLSSLLSGLQHQSVFLEMPRFTYTSEFSLSDTLQSLGMQDAFEQFGADFSGMSTEAPLYILEVLHQAFVAVNEAGTEAAAATAVVVSHADGGVAPEPTEFIVDRPFIGRVEDPSS